ncbi:VapE domain-containing protein [Paraburkholderia phosphatilytica]|uniref:VapE domain-containing protein n=1 Tax=Paraburkholderia phosphatilytica TaxID=2282883 RepID=UPI000E530A9A|nr:VapE domain-containing protein [Paraburkholderia phosphatilytica]
MGAPNVEENSHVENSVQEQRLRVFDLYPKAKLREDGYYDCYDTEGICFTTDEDGLTLGAVGFGAKVNARRAEERKKQTLAAAEGQARLLREKREGHKNLVERAKALLAVPDLISFIDLRRDPDITPAQATAMKAMGQAIPVLPSPTSINMQRFFDALFVGGTIDDVHYDTARRMLVDEQGAVVDDEWAARDLMEAARAAKLKGLSAEVLIKELKVWAKTYKFNDISERIKARLANVVIDADDALEDRMEMFLIQTFNCVDSPDNRLFSKYWCLSLFNRIMSPGCLAPITMALFGPQDAGKSYFSTLLCRALMFDPGVDAVPYDPVSDRKEFLRNIYGLSIVANMSEMTGFGKIDLRKWKSFSTNTTDTFDQKFGFSGPWRRQWIFITDANRYEGLWRDSDDTDANDESQGERRMFPIFVGEIPGATGSVRWAPDAKASLDPEVFAERLWLMMKACQIWMEYRDEGGYKKVVAATTSMVKRFSKAEKDADQGTVRDKTLDEHFPHVVYRCVRNHAIISDIRVDGEKVRGLRLLTKDIQTAYEHITKRVLTPQQIAKKMKAVGAKKGRAGGGVLNVTAFVFDDLEFGAFRDGDGDREEFVKAFVQLYLREETPDKNDGKSQDEIESEGF